MVGLSGVFVLETKARPRRRATRKQEEHVVVFDGKALQFPWCVDWDAVGQAERNARWMRKFLDGYGPEGLRVQPLIVVPGWYVSRGKGEYSVLAMNAGYLVDNYLLAEKPIYTTKQLGPVVKRLAEECRDLEF